MVSSDVKCAWLRPSTSGKSRCPPSITIFSTPHCFTGLLFQRAGSKQERILTDFAVTSFPAVLGIDSSGERVMYTGESKLEPLSAWLETLERKAKSGSSFWGWGARSASKPESGLEKNGMGFLSRGSVGRLCGPNCSLCVIAVVPTAAQSEEASSILRTVSRDAGFSRLVLPSAPVEGDRG